MTIHQYDRILLDDGRTGTVVEVLKADECYLVDVDLPDPDWDTIEVEHRHVRRVYQS